MKRTLTALLCAAATLLAGCSAAREYIPAYKAPTASTTSSVPAEEPEIVSDDLDDKMLEATSEDVANYGSETSKPSEDSEPSVSTAAPTISVSGSISDIKAVCGLVSEAEKSLSACIVDTDSKTNPYDVVYDYGKAFDAFAAACDWSLVFDADYYIANFPMLALQYHNDKALLLEHFRTVGIQEGRQGNASFNVGVYKSNCDPSVSGAFGNEYEGYYFYYMLNYSSEKSVKAIDSDVKLQQTSIMTAVQAEEFAGNNKYRAEVGVPAMAFNSEAAAFANYRSYINAHDNYLAHYWMMANLDYIRSTVMPAVNASAYCENETDVFYVQTSADSHLTHATCYRNSPSHYETMITPKFNAFGTSNCYTSKTNRISISVDTFFTLK